MGKLDKATDTAPYMRLKSKIDELKADPRYQFMFSGMLVGDTMAASSARSSACLRQRQADLDHRRLGRAVGHHLDRGRGAQRLVFDYAIWGREEKTRPILLVCEEAHRYVPNEKNADGSSVGKILEPDRQGRPQVRRRSA
jgi:uncharacterized protein